MPWKERSVMSQRQELVALAVSQADSIAALCRRFGISRETGHKWLRRLRSQRGVPSEQIALAGVVLGHGLEH